MKKLPEMRYVFSLYMAVAVIILSTLSGCSGKSEGKDKVLNMDRIKPLIVLKGTTDAAVFVGEPYVDAGAKAIDDIDGEISSKIKVTITKGRVPVEKVDTTTGGEFFIKYGVTDSAGNTAEGLTRKVTVQMTRDDEALHSETVYIGTGTADIRSKIGRDGERVTVINKGAELQTIKEASDDDGAVWLNVTYRGSTGKKTGWVKKESTTVKKDSQIYKSYKNLDYSPHKKIEYQNNPRIKAKGIYVTLYSAGGKKLDSFIDMTKRTEINAFVIDVKDDDGYLLFHMKAGEKYAPKANKRTTVKDISAFMKKLKKNKIYTIARIVSFKDPIYTEAHPDRAIVYKNTGKPFTNSDNLRWATAYDRKLWEYNIAVAKEAVAAGFNEVQFDYVRFPASNGGKLDKLLDYRNTRKESKPQAIQEYLKYARKELSPMGVYISADVYGLVSSVKDDMGIGQYWEAVSNIVDYICPMMYPSHYSKGVYGLSVPDAFPYATVYNSSKDAIKRNKNIKTPGIVRPWIQDFTAPWVKGHIKYGNSQVAEQIKALKANGIEEYLLWNASNRYSEGAVRR